MVPKAAFLFDILCECLELGGGTGIVWVGELDVIARSKAGIITACRQSP